MTVYALIIGSLLFGGILYNSKECKNHRKAIVVLMAILLTTISGLRYGVGTDYLTYMRGYKSYVNNEISWLSQPAVNIIARVSKIVYDDYLTWFIIMAIIAIVPAIIIMYKHSEMPELSIILFVLLGCWHFSFNIVKQCAAAAILFCGYDSLVNRKIKNWICLCLIASMFHFSAVLMIPVYFIVDKKVSYKTLGIYLFISLFTLIFYDRLFELASFMKQDMYTVSENSATKNNSVNIFRILVNTAPGFLFLVYRKSCNMEDKKFLVAANMMLLNIALNIGAMNSIYLYRICTYTNIFNVLFIPYIIRIIRIPDRYFVLSVILILYSIFWWHDLSVGSSLKEFHWIFER